MAEQTFNIKKQGQYFVAYDTVDKKKSYGKINIDTGKFTGDTRCMIALDKHRGDYRDNLINTVLEQFRLDILEGDLTCLDELLQLTPTKNLIAYLPE
jgi:hypothetical protein